MLVRDGGERVRQIRGLLMDLDGVLYVGPAPVEGAAGALAALRSRGLPLRFLSNSTRRSRASVSARLQAMGLAIGEGEILTPAVAAARWLADRGMRRSLLLTTGDVDRDFRAGGITPVQERADAVVLGDAGEGFTYGSLNHAMRLVLDGALLVALEKDRVWMAEDGLSLSAGPFVAALEYATGREAQLVGKPSPDFFGQALQELGIPPGEAAMVGDDIRSDIDGAQRAGMAGILVRTGKYREDVVRASGITPNAVIGSVADLPGLLPSP
jgi:HAD superfamily hydrolase (TIGR01458 family)